MATETPATRFDVGVIGATIILIIGLAGAVFWIPTKEAVRRIENARCTQTVEK